jgi:class 3 adenylate cyclase/tetratricopeptide (TPR) repeat protein
VRICPRCGEPNPERARFCLNCGARLDSPSTAGEERRLVTVLFCDLVGFTERSDHADPEDVKATLLLFHSILKGSIEHFGGVVDKFIGDAVMGVFGAPVGHEDDPVRAVFAAFEIQARIAELDARQPGLDLQARVGITTGEAIVSYGQGPQIGESVTGDVVNTASRLQNVARPGGIVVGEATERATRHRFVYEEREPATVKGKAEPLRIFEPLRARSRMPADLSERPRTTFVGRDDEAARLRTIFRQVSETETGSGHGARDRAVQLVTVSGDPGVGKTRLVQEFAEFLDELPQLVRLRQGRCLPYGEGVSFWALGEIVKGEAGILDSDPPEDAEAKLVGALEVLGLDRGEVDWLRQRLAPLVGIGSPSRDAKREELFAAWLRFLEALAADSITVAVFEDLHWADAAMLDFLEHVVDHAQPVPLLVLATARPELYDRRPNWGEDRRNAITLHLPPLTESETAILLSALLDRAVLPAPTQAILLERAGGNPLFAEEFVQMLLDRGSLARGSEGGAASLGAEAVPVPESLQALIGARLDALSPPDRSLLHDASVVGKIFWSGALAEVSGRSEERVLSDLEELARKQLVRPARTSSVADQHEFAFWHVLIRDVAYGQLPRAVRIDKHLAAARWIRRVAGDREVDFAEELAHHYVEALDMATATGDGGTDVDALATETGEALVLAGDRVIDLDAPRADAYFRRALQLLPRDGAERGRLLLRAGQTAFVAGRFEESERTFRQAIETFRAAGDRLGTGEAMSRLARALTKRGNVSEAGPMYDEAIVILEAEPAGPELCHAYGRKAGQLLLKGDYLDSRRLADRALQLATEMHLEDEVVRSLQIRGAARADLGDDGGLDDLREAIRLGLEAGIGEEVALSYGNLGYELWFREGPRVAQRAWQDMESYSRTRGFMAHVMWARTGQLETLFDLGDWDRVQEIASDLEAWDREQGGSQVGTYARFFRAWVDLRRGDVTEATALAEEFLPKARRLEFAEYQAPALMIAAEAARARGDLEAASDLIHEFASATEQNPDYRALFIPVAARVLVAVGDVETAARLIPDDALTTRHRIGVRTARAVVAEGRGDLREAASAYAEATDRWRDYGFVLEEGTTALGLGRCLLALGDGTGAADALERARAVLTPLGTLPLIEEIDLLDDGADADVATSS